MKVLLFLLLLPTYLFSQVIEKKGLIVLNTNDTVSGTISYKKYNVPESQIAIVTKGVKQFYNAIDIKKVIIGDEMLFERHTVTYHPGSIDLRFLSDSFNTKKDTITTLLKVLYKSSHSLYLLETKERSYFFTADGNNAVVELLYRAKNSANGNIEFDYTYRQQLTDIAQKSNNSKKALNKATSTNYSHNNLLSFFTTAMNSNSNFSSKADMKSKFDISTGLAFNSFKTSNTQLREGIYTFATDKANFKSNTSITINTGFTLSSNKLSPLLLYKIGFGYNLYKTTGGSSNGGAFYTNEQYSFKISMIDIIGSINYRIADINKARLYAGPYFGFSRIMQKKISSTFANATDTVTYTNFPYFNGGYGLYGGNIFLELQRNKISLLVYRSSNIFHETTAWLKATTILLTYGFYLKQ